MYRSILVFLGALFLLAPVAWGATETDDLQDSFSAVLEELNSKDLDGFLSRWHEEAVLFVPRQFFPIDRLEAGREVWNEIFEDFFSSTTSARINPVNVEYRVVGDTGIVWGMTQSVIEPRGGDRRVDEVRLTATFVRTPSGWKILNWHGAVPPARPGSLPGE